MLISLVKNSNSWIKLLSYKTTHCLLVKSELRLALPVRRRCSNSAISSEKLVKKKPIFWWINNAYLEINSNSWITQVQNHTMFVRKIRKCHEKYDEHIWQDLNFDWHFRCAGDALIRQYHLKKMVKKETHYCLSRHKFKVLD